MKDVEKKVVKKKKLNFKRIIILLLFVYIIGCFFYYLFNLPIKNIYIKGNNRVTEYEIISTAKIKNYPSLFKISKKSIIKSLEKIPLINNVTVEKNLLGKLTITIEENKILFLQKSTNKMYLSNNNSIEDNNYLGVPILVNYVPDELFIELITAFNKLDNDILIKISEIEYSQYKTSTGDIIDDERFLLRMNDGNTVYINLVNIKKMNLYDKIYLTLEGKGTLYLDSEEEEKVVFESYS